MHAEMVKAFKNVFGDNAKAPKPNFTAAGTMLKIRREQGEKAYEDAMAEYISRKQNEYYGYSNMGGRTAKARGPRTKAVAAAPAAAPVAPLAPMPASPTRSAKTRRNAIRSLETIMGSLENVLASLRAEEGAPGAARPPSPRRMTQKRVATPPAARTKSRTPTRKVIPGQQAIVQARKGLEAQAGVKISQKIAAPFAKWAKGRAPEEVRAKEVNVAAALRDRRGRNDNAIAVNVGLKTQANVEKLRLERERAKAKKTGR